MQTHLTQKILIITGLFHPFIGGAERECQNLAKKLISQGHCVTIMTGYVEGLPPFEMVEGIPVYRKIRGWHLFELTYMISVLLLLWRHRKSFNHILCFGLYLYTAPAVLFALCTGKKALLRLKCSGISGDFQCLSQLKSENFIIGCSKLAHRVLAVSNEIEQDLLLRGFAKKKVFHILNSVDIEKFHPLANSKLSNIPCISFIGRLDRQKGVDILLQALKILADRGILFNACIVGDGPSREDLINDAKRLSLLDHIQFAGMQQDTVPFYRQSTILALPSRYEGLPHVALEAMACNVAIVGSYVGGIPEVLDPEGAVPAMPEAYRICKNGILMPPDAPIELAAAIQNLLDDTALREQLGANARQYIETHYTLDAVADQYLKLIATV